MNNRIKNKNYAIGFLLLAALFGTAYEGFQMQQLSKINTTLLSGEVLNDDGYPFHKKFSDAYQQGKSGNYKHAIQGFGQLLEPPKMHQENIFEINKELKSQIHFNIGNNLFRSGLQRLVASDGSIQEDAKFDYLQAKASYEQALRLNPQANEVKFNLSLLNAVIPGNIKTVPQDPSGMEISNLPQGLP